MGIYKVSIVLVVNNCFLFLSNVYNLVSIVLISSVEILVFLSRLTKALADLICEWSAMACLASLRSCVSVSIINLVSLGVLEMICNNNWASSSSASVSGSSTVL